MSAREAVTMEEGMGGMGRHVESGTKASFDHMCCVGGNIPMWFLSGNTI